MNINAVSANGSNPFDDLMLEVQKGTYNIALCSMWMILQRYKVCDFSVPYSSSSFTFLVPRPTLLSDAVAIYYSLSGSVWLAFIVCLMLVSCVFAVVSKFVRIEKRDERSLVQFNLYLVDIATGHGSPYFPPNFYIRHLLIRLV